MVRRPFDTVSLQKPTTPKSRSRYRTVIGRIILFGILVCGSAFMGYRVYQFVTTPAIGTITKNTPTVFPSNQDSKLQQKVGRYVAFSYTSEFELRTNDPVATNSLESYLLLIKTIAGYDHMTVAVEKLSHPLSEDASYRIRKDHPEEYSSTTRTIAGGSAEVFLSKTGDFSEVLFSVHGDLLLTISTTANFGSAEDNINKFNALVGSLRWLQ